MSAEEIIRSWEKIREEMGNKDDLLKVVKLKQREAGVRLRIAIRDYRDRLKSISDASRKIKK